MTKASEPPMKNSKNAHKARPLKMAKVIKNANDVTEKEEMPAKDQPAEGARDVGDHTAH